MKLEEKLDDLKNRIGLVGTRIKFSRPEAGRGITEFITNDWKELVVRIRKGIDLAPDEETKRYLEKIASEDPLETIAFDMVYHGCGHRELHRTGLGCPYSVENHDKILDGVARALKEKGKSRITLMAPDGQAITLEHYLANAFEDILDNVNARRYTRHAGQILFWNNEGLEGETENYLEFYEAFVKINLGMFGRAEDATLLRRFFSDSDKVRKAVKDFRDYLKMELETNNLTRTHEKSKQFEKLFNQEKWNEYAYRFALATADLIEPGKTAVRLCFGLEGEGNPFDRLIRIPLVQEKLAHDRYKAGIGPSQHTDQLLQLDALYRRISKEIPVKTSEYTDAEEMPIATFGKRDLKDGEIVRVSRIKGLGLDEDGDLTLKVGRHELTDPASYKIHPRNFPKMKVALLDTSGSMGYNSNNEHDNSGNPVNIGDTGFIPWGNKSKYHFALKGLYGIDNFLESQGVAPYTQHTAIVFGGETKATSGRNFRSEEERRSLLQNPSGGTTIDPKVLEDAVMERSFLVSVSDGDIQNWNSIKQGFKKVIERTDYCHIHIGNKNQFTTDLESWGVKVHYVRGDEDLSRLMIDAASKYYKEGEFK